MTDTSNEKFNDTEGKDETGVEAKKETHDQRIDSDRQTASGNFREASYVVLFIAAVFVINAMETGSYRTPWPVAIITALLGLVLFGYSWYQQGRHKVNKR